MYEMANCSSSPKAAAVFHAATRASRRTHTRMWPLQLTVIITFQFISGLVDNIIIIYEHNTKKRILTF